MLEDTLKAVKEAEAKSEQTIKDAEVQAAKILEEAKAKAQKMKEETLSKVKSMNQEMESLRICSSLQISISVHLSLCNGSLRVQRGGAHGRQEGRGKAQQTGQNHPCAAAAQRQLPVPHGGRQEEGIRQHLNGRVHANQGGSTAGD